MHTGTKDNSRLGYAKGGKIQCMAEGGLVQQIKAGVNRLVGNNPTAMAQRGRSETADAPPPATTTATEPVLKAKGGPIPKPAKGAPPHPEAMGTDTVPIMGTPGEFMVRKPAVDKIEAMAPGLLNALNAMGDDKPKLGKIKRRRRGKRKGYQDGGSIFDEYRNPRPRETPPPSTNAVPRTPNVPAPYVNHRAPSGPPMMAPQARLTNGMPPPGTAVTAPSGPNFTMGANTPSPGTVVPSAVTDVTPKPPKAPTLAIGYDERAAASKAIGDRFNPAPQAPSAANNFNLPPNPAPNGAAPAAAPVAPAAPQSRLGRVARTIRGAGAAMAAGAGGEVLANQTRDIGNPAGTPDGNMPVDPLMAQIPTGGVPGAGPTPATQPYNFYTDTEAGRNIGNMANAVSAIPGLGVVSKFVRPAAAGAAAVQGFGAQVRADRGVGASVAAAPSTGAGAGRGFVNPAAVVPETAPAPTAADAGSVPVAPPMANITRVGNSYSGPAGISGPVTINGKTPGGGFVGNAGAGAPVRLGANPSIDMALSEARDQAMARGDFNAVRRSYGGDFGAEKVDPIQALINNGRPMTTRKAAAIAQLQAARAQAEGATATRDMEGQRLAMDKETTDLSNREKKGLLSAQDAYANARTPEERAAAEQRLRAVQGKYDKEAPNRFTVVPGGQEIGADGIPFTRPSSVINNQTGEFVNQPAAAPRTLPPGLKVGATTKQADGTYNAAGKTVVIKGGKITEIK